MLLVLVLVDVVVLPPPPPPPSPLSLIHIYLSIIFRLNLPKKRVLKPNAVSHLNLPLCSSLVNSSNSLFCVKRKIRAEKRNNQKEVQNLLQLSNKQ